LPNTSDHVALDGGEDLVSSGLVVQPNRAQLLLNYYVDINGGYTSEKGYVSFDGRPITLTFTGGSGATTPGSSSMITIGTVTASVVAISVSSGTFAGGNAAGTVTISDVHGGGVHYPSAGAAAFSDGQVCTVTVVAAPQPVPGTGPVTGVWLWNGDLYAVRNNSVNDILYKATATGWVAAATGWQINYATGGGGVTAPMPVRGATLTQGGSTATISGVTITSGNFLTSGNAVGTIYVHSNSGVFTAGVATYNAAGNTLTLGGAGSGNVGMSGAATRYHFINNNFSAAAGQELMYFAREGGSPFEYDGNCLVPILSGLSTNTPSRLVAHGNRLFLAFPGGSLAFSSPGNPTTGFTQDYTAGTVSLGEDITDIVSTTGGALLVLGRTRSKVLTGNISGASGDMQLRELSTKIGAVPYTGQPLNDVYFVGEDGVRSLAQTDKYGDFAGSSLSEAVAPFAREIARVATHSAVFPSLGQYRVYAGAASGTTFLSMTFAGGQMRGSGRGFYRFNMTSLCVGQYNGEESAFAGSFEGFVYRLMHGRSHDGLPFLRGVILSYNSHGNPVVEKQWRRMQLHIDSDGELNFSYGLTFNWGAKGHASANSLDGYVPPSGGTWGTATWGQFSWGGVGQNNTAELDIFGVGRNFSLTIQSRSDNEPQHTIRGYSVIFEGRRLLR
jgi:hypothetical protein